MPFYASREFYIPQGASKVTDKATGAVVYYKESKGGYSAVGFSGKSQKPRFNYRFGNMSQMEKYVSQFFSALRSAKEAKESRRKERFAPHNVVVGDVFGASWGYDQTNVDWYEVVALRGKNTVYVRKISANVKETGFMSGTSKPLPGCFANKELIMCRVNMSGGSPSLNIDGKYATRGDKPRYCSWYA